MRYCWWVLLGWLAISTAAYAAADIAVGEAKAKVLCAACHRQQAGQANPMWPTIAGQHATYAIVQLKAFKAGKLRQNPLMTAVMTSLTAEDIEGLAAYFAQLPPVAIQARSEPSLIDQGRGLYQAGDLRKGLVACIACHGPDGKGNAQAGFPMLAGQYPQYLVAQLKAYRADERQTGVNHIMQMVAARMSDQDMASIAAYVANLN